ncbi:MAG TPA: dynamin family protein [Oculatellaceae cyanobacterium]
MGEFSQGKSTLLNALLREEIQPVRAIPCSGTVTVLRYGTQKRVICRYKDGREEEIPLDQYKVKAAIPKEAAQDHRSNELGNSDIDEIIFEHPDLDLCRSGVEIIDSPGLNEHPERTAITQKLLKDTDAAIFLTNAQRLLSEKEKELIQDVRLQLNSGSKNEPAENLFVLVNFMDMLDEEEDRQDVIQRLERFVKEKNLLSKTESRIHYISAKAALKAIVKGDENEHLKAFQSFTQSIEKFLTFERGSQEIKQSATKINDLIQLSLEGLHQAEEILEGKLKLSETEKQKLLEQIGEASGRNVKLRILAEKLRKEAIQEAVKSWGHWKNGLSERMAEKSKQWRSEHSHIFSQDKLAQDYVDQFIRDIQEEIDEWGNTQLGNEIINPKMVVLGREIINELEALQQNLKLLGQQISDNFSLQLDFIIGGLDWKISGAGGFLGGLGAGGALAGLLAFTGVGAIPLILAVLATSLTGSVGFGLLDIDDIQSKIKSKVCEVGFQKFEESKIKVADQLYEIICSAFRSRAETANTAIKQIISSYENLLEQQEKADAETLEQRQAEKAWIAHKRQELEQVQKNIEAILPNS